MDGFLTLLLFAGFFYVMMRFGCGAHMVHGRHGGHGKAEHKGHGEHGAQESFPKDPVCGMDVTPGQGHVENYVENYKGRELQFCYRECLDKFDSEPQRYVS